jgi:hypothetical protein
VSTIDQALRGAAIIYRLKIFSGENLLREGAMNAAAPRDSYQRRAHVRLPVSFKARVGLGSGTMPVEMRNVSANGFGVKMCDPAAGLGIGAAGEIELPEGSVRSVQIVWQLGDSAGGTFDPPLTDAEVIQMLVLDAKHGQGLAED